MHLLLVEPNELLRSQWATRLKTESSQVLPVGDEFTVRKVLAKLPVATAFVRYPLDWAGNEQELLDLLKSSCQFIVAMTDGSQAASERAYESGFIDCIDDSCGHNAIRSKLTHAENLEHLNQRLAQAQKLESIGELAAGIAHEINTPIQYVGDNTRFVQDSCIELLELLSKSNQLLESSRTNGKHQEATECIRELLDEADIEYLIDEIPSAIQQTLEGVDRVSNIVRAMKEFAHPGVSEMVPTDLAKSIENTLMVARNEWKYVAESETEFDSRLPLVHCLPGELNQVLLNMIVNAAHAIGDTLSETPGSKGTIRLETHLRGSHAEIRISDTGAGISPRNVEQIFTPFFTTKSAGKGTGQGLAIAHSVIVEKHAGSIEVESQLGHGTTFVIQIPIEPRRESSSTESSDMNGEHSLSADAVNPSQTPQEV